MSCLDTSSETNKFNVRFQLRLFWWDFWKDAPFVNLGTATCSTPRMICFGTVEDPGSQQETSARHAFPVRERTSEVDVLSMVRCGACEQSGLR